MNSAIAVVLPFASPWVTLADHRRRDRIELRGASYADRGSAFPLTTGSSGSSTGSSVSTTADSTASSLVALDCLRLSMRATHRARSGPTEVARNSTDERRL